jgi:hypothetical protein
MIQGMRDKVSIAGFVRDGNRNTFLSADAPRVEMNTAKEILRKLYESAPGTGWHVDIQSEVVTIHCNLHDTYAYRCPLRSLGKGLFRVKHIGREMVERIQAGV